MPNIAERLSRIQDYLNTAGREASFSEDRGFGGGNPEPYRQAMLEQFQAEPQLKRFLPLLWRDFDKDYQRFFTSSDGVHEPDFIFAYAALNPTHATTADWSQGRSSLHVHPWDESTFILRQNLSSNPQAPFAYLLIGTAKALLIDTGAPLTNGATYWPFVISSTATGMVERNRVFHDLPALELLVMHTSAREDHHAGDSAFQNQGGIRMIAPSAGTLDLGGRIVHVLRTPGTSLDAYSFYDDRTQLLLTGDLFYPGRLSVNSWPDFCASISNLVEFTALHPITAILGAHIEMAQTPAQDFPPDDTSHANERELALHREDLLELHELCQSLGATPLRTCRKNFILVPPSS